MHRAAISHTQMASTFHCGYCVSCNNNAMRRFLITFGCIVLFTFPAITFAVDCTTDKTTGFVPLACYQGSALQDLYSTSGDNALASFFNKLFTFSLSIGAILAVVMIVWGGSLYMFKDSFAAKTNAKEKITNAVIGLLLLLGIYLILYQINPDILKLEILFPKSSGNPALQSAPPASSVFVDGQQRTCYRDPSDPNHTICP